MSEESKVPKHIEQVFKKAQDLVSKYFQTKHEDPSKGLIEISGERYILIRAASMSIDFFETVKDLYKDKGEEEAFNVTLQLLYDVSHAIGKADAKNFMSKMNLANPLENLLAGPVHFSHSGWANVHIHPESRPTPDNNFLLVYDLPRSFEADAWKKAKKVSQFPICIMNAGYSSGWCEESIGITLVSSEIYCTTKGDDSCRFIMAHPSRIQGYIKEYLQKEGKLTQSDSVYEIPGFFKRKLMEEALQVSENWFRSLFEASPDFIHILDTEGNIVQTNPASVMELGYSEDEMIGKKISDYFTPPAREMFIEQFPMLLEYGTNRQELEILRKDGRILTLDCSASGVQDERGKYKYFVVFQRDITERKQHERELLHLNRQLEKSVERAVQLVQESNSANRAKSKFLANMSHEIRTPLNGIIGFSEMLLNEELSNEQRDSTEIIHRSAHTLLTLLSDVLDLSKIEADQMDLDRIPFNLENLLMDAAESAQIKAAGKPIEIMCDIQEIQSRVIGDPTRFRQVVTNLLDNAVKFTDRGEILVALHMLEETDNRIKIEISISDSGIGISSDKQGSIFELFTQVDGSATRKYGGTGLGLAISQKLVRLMEGEIRVKSSEGVGSTFSFNVWLHKFSSEETVTSSSIRGLADWSVLLVEDNLSMMQILTKMLKRAGMQLTCVSNGIEAIEMFKTCSFDLAIVDLRKSGLNMDEFAEAISEIYHECLPQMIALVSNIDREGTQNWHSGYYGFVTKPVRRKVLLSKIRQTVEIEGDIIQPNTDLQSQKNKPSVYLRLLIAEDNIVNQKMLVTMLARLGHSVDLAENGLQAVAMAQSQNYDLIFMDIHMPGMDGIRATEELRRANITTPIVAVTANAIKGVKEKCLEAGMNEFITKPIRSEIIEKALSRFCISEQRTMSWQSLKVILIEQDLNNLQILESSILQQFPGSKIKTAKNGLDACMLLGNFVPDLLITDVMIPGLESTALLKHLKENEMFLHTKVIVLSSMDENDDRIRTIRNLGITDIIPKPIKLRDISRILQGKKPDESPAAENPQNDVTEEGNSPIETVKTVWNEKFALKMTENDSKFLIQLFDMFANDIPERLNRISTALETRNIELVQREAHTIKGAAANLGGERCREAAYTMEKTVDSEDMEHCKKQYSQLFHEVELLLEQFGNFKERYNDTGDELRTVSGTG